MFQETSKQAFKDAKTRINFTQSAVLEALQDISPATNRMVAKHLGWEINSVTPRMLELRNKKKVVEAYKAVDGQRRAIYWKPRLVDVDDRGER